MTTASGSAAIHSRLPAPDWRHLVTSAAWTGFGFLVIIALLLAVRRLAGAIAQPIPGPLLVPLATGIAMASVLVRLWLIPRSRSSFHGTGADWLVLVVPSVALVILLVALLTPGTTMPAALAALLLAAVIEALFWRHIAVMLRPVEAAPTPRQETAPESAEEIADDESYAPNLLQQIVRTREGSGETIHAVLRAEFQPGEQVHVLHVAFCPPLEIPPRIDAYATGEMEAEVKITGAFTFGARLEVTLPAPASGLQTVVVELSGRSDGTG